MISEDELKDGKRHGQGNCILTDIGNISCSKYFSGDYNVESNKCFIKSSAEQCSEFSKITNASYEWSGFGEISSDEGHLPPVVEPEAGPVAVPKEEPWVDSGFDGMLEDVDSEPEPEAGPVAVPRVVEPEPEAGPEPALGVDEFATFDKQAEL